MKNDKPKKHLVCVKNKIIKSVNERQKKWLKENDNNLIRAELNLCKLHPIWELSTTQRQTKEISKKHILQDGNEVIKKITIGQLGKRKVGVFTVKKHFKVMLGLIKLSEEQGHPDECYFGIHRLAEILGLKWGGNICKFLQEAVIELSGIPIILENTFYDNIEKEPIKTTKVIYWLKNITIVGRLKKGQPSLALCSFKFNKYLRDNLRSGYTKPLFLSEIIKFKTELAILLYNHIDLVMNDKYHYQRNLLNLLQNDFKLDTKFDYKYKSQRKILFTPCIKELQGARLSTGILADIELEKTKDGKDYKIVCRKIGANVKLVEEKIPAIEKSKGYKLVGYFLKKLGKQGRHPNKKEISQAEVLIGKYGEDGVKYIIDFALKSAGETNFDMQWFGAILKYGEEAIWKYEQAQIYQNTGQSGRSREENLREKYEIYKLDKVEAFKKKQRPQDLKIWRVENADETHKKYPWLKKPEQSQMIKDTLESFFNDWLIKTDKVKLLSLDEWLEQERAKNKNRSSAQATKASV